MHRTELLQTLSLYAETWAAGSFPYPGFSRAEEQGIVAAVATFVRSHPGCFERHEPSGHVTASTLIASPDLQRVLLTLHGKLGLWLQLGGHVDGEPHVHVEALREATEESGLTGLRFLPYEASLPPLAQARLDTPVPFDFDFHPIPARRDEAAHIHYDVRYLLVADPSAALVMTPESKDLRWFTLAEAREVTSERSMHRQFDKLEWLRGHLALS